jgi:hypothetical protein
MKDIFEHLKSVLSDERFLSNKSSGNEVPFYIFPYKVKDSIEIEKLQKQLINSLPQMGVNILNINLYDLCIDILKKNDDWDWYIKEEASMSKDEFKEELQSMLDVETVLIPAIAEKMNEADFNVMFISGVGEVFPYIRSHNILNNLQSTAKVKPTLMFFPGSYTQSIETGASLDLFDKLHDDKYYRAFNIEHYEI